MDQPSPDLRSEIEKALSERLERCNSDEERKAATIENESLLQALEQSNFFSRTSSPDIAEEKYTENLTKRLFWVFQNLCDRIDLKVDEGKIKLLDGVLLLSWLVLQKKQWGHDSPVYQRQLPERPLFHSTKPKWNGQGDMDVPDEYLLNFLKASTYEGVIKHFQNEIRQYINDPSSIEGLFYTAVFRHTDLGNWEVLLHEKFIERFKEFLAQIIKVGSINTPEKLRAIAEEVMDDLCLQGLYVLSNQYALHVYDEIAKKTFKQVYKTMTRGERRMWILLRFMNGARLGGPRKTFFYGRIFREDISLNNFVFSTGRRTIELVKEVVFDKKQGNAKELQERWLTYLRYYGLFIAAEYDWEKHRAYLDEQYLPDGGRRFDSLNRTKMDAEEKETPIYENYPDSSVDDPLEQAQLTNMLRAIDALPDRQRQIVNLKSEGKTEREIADELGIKQPTVNEALQAAAKTLKKKGFFN